MKHHHDKENIGPEPDENNIASPIQKVPDQSINNEKAIDIEKINEFIYLEDYNLKDVNIFDSSFSNVNTAEDCETASGLDISQPYQPNDDQPAHETLRNINTSPETVLQQTTKSGKDRKRKFHDVPLAERKKRKFEEKVAKFGVKPPCKCQRKCSELISQEQMKSINSQFWTFNWQTQRMFVVNNAEILKVARKKNDSTRNFTYKYFLPTNSGGTKVQVCKVFFLATLGYLPGNDKMVNNTLYSAAAASVSSNNNNNTEERVIMPMVQIDKRGKYCVISKLTLTFIYVFRETSI